METTIMGLYRVILIQLRHLRLRVAPLNQKGRIRTTQLGSALKLLQQQIPELTGS